MILNVSGRTDIVAFYTPWFINRYKEGFVDVRNPFVPKKISRIYFNEVEMIVFCTKNPLPIMPFLDEIKQPIIFQITLTPYKKDIEPNVIEKEKIIKAIKEISKKVGKENVYIRYDPILINQIYTIDYHKKAFLKLCSLLKGDIAGIIISFIDVYKNVLNNAKDLKLKELKKEDYEKLGKTLGEIGKNCHVAIQTCFEKIDLTKYHIENKPCVSKNMALLRTGKKYKLWSARKCGCVEMVDIGTYNTCSHLCKYCYANYQEKEVLKNQKKHDPNSSLLIGNIVEEDQITIRKNKRAELDL